MRAVVVSSVALGVVALISAGIVFTRFIAKSKYENESHSETANSQNYGINLDEHDDDFDLANILGETAPTPPQKPKPQNNRINTETEALAAQQAVSGCIAAASKKIHVRDWSNLGSVNAIAQGDDCYNSIVRIAINSSDGKTLFSMSAPAKDFGISPNADSKALSAALNASLPDSSIRAAAYPAWTDDDDTPYGTEFNRETYQRIRENNIPVICVKVPSAPQTCVAYDAAVNKLKTFQRG